VGNAQAVSYHTFITVVILVNTIKPTMVTLANPSYPLNFEVTDAIRKIQWLNSGESIVFLSSAYISFQDFLGFNWLRSAVTKIRGNI
jgi:hypothetical protein